MVGRVLLFLRRNAICISLYLFLTRFDSRWMERAIHCLLSPTPVPALLLKSGGVICGFSKHDRSLSPCQLSISLIFPEIQCQTERCLPPINSLVLVSLIQPFYSASSELPPLQNLSHGSDHSDHVLYTLILLLSPSRYMLVSFPYGWPPSHGPIF